VRCIKRGNEAGLLLEVRDRDLALSDDVIGQVRPALGLFINIFRAFALRRTRLVNEIRKSCNIHKAILYHFGVKSSPSPYSH
jgi:hypothetical protein